MVFRYFWRYLLPGLALIGAGFLAGGQKNATLGLFSFLCFFVIGVTLIIEGWKKTKNTK